MKTTRIAPIAAAVTALVLGAPASGADFGVMETAEPIEPRHFKLSGYPIVTDRDRSLGGGADGAFAVALGYGLPYRLDVEGMVARHDDGTYFGSDIEWSPWKLDWVEFSFGGGLHTIDLERGGTVMGLDSSAIFTFSPVYRLDINAAVDMSFEDVNAETETPGRNGRYDVDNTHETYYFVPGVEYQLTHNLDVVGEAGLGLNGASDDYVGTGLSWYFR